MAKLGVVAIAKAHPLIFGAVLAVSIGIVVYQIVKSKKQKRLRYSRQSEPDCPSGGGGGAVSCEEFVSYEEMKSNTNSAAPVKSDSTDSRLRKRQIALKKSFNIANPETSPGKKCNSSAGNFDNNQNILESKVLSDKNLDNAMSADEKVNEYLRNISSAELTDSNEESDSACYYETSSTDSNEESDSTNDIVKPIKKYNSEPHSAEISYSSSDAGSSSWDHVSLTDVNNLNKQTRACSICSAESIGTESSVGTVLSGDSEICKACKKNPVNTSTQPCNHRYMCSDCAFRIFPLFKRCKVCRSRIERIVVEE